MHRFTTALVGSILASTACAQFTLVTPAGYAATEGGANNGFPWNRGTASTRIQFIVDSTHFTSQGATFPIVITQLAYRAENATTTTSWAGGSWPSVRIDMASCPVDYLAASTTFANNLGADLTTVKNGTVAVAAGSGSGIGVPGPWYITIPLTTSFLYDPMLGNDLVVDVYQDGAGWTGTSTNADHVATTGLPAPLGTRVFNTTATALTATTGSVGLNYGAVTEFTYVPANGLFANFVADFTGGTSPLAVTFSNYSYTSDPGGITSWAWDFDGDTVIDSTAQNPSFVYTNCGTYTVSLTVTDASHAPHTLTRPNYVVTDTVAANFTSQVIGPLLVQFTDTTTPAATSWAWDFNGDTVVDSTAQNPVYAFPSSSPQNVRLTASRLCAAASTVTKSVSPLQQLSTNLIANNSIGTPATLYLNLDVFNPAGATITSLDSYSATLNAAFTVDVFLKQGLYQGSELNATPWTKVATASGTSAPATGQPSNVTFPLPLHIPQGSYGVAMRFVGITPRYVANTGLLTYNNTDLAITVGAVSLSTSGAFTGTSLLPSRAWSGTLYYTTNNVGNFAGYGWFGQGCPSTLGRTNIVGTNRPTLGGTLTTSLDNLPWGIAVMVLGLSNTVSGGTLPLPLDVGFLGAPGCSLRVSLDVTDTVVGTAPNGAWSLAIPNDPLLMGFLVYNQAAVFDPAANTFGFALSHAYGSVLGN